MWELFPNALTARFYNFRLKRYGQTNGLTGQQTDGPTDGQSLLQNCVPCCHTQQFVRGDIASSHRVQMKLLHIWNILTQPDNYGPIDEWMDGRRDGKTGRWTGQQMDRWTDEQLDYPPDG